VNPLSDRNVLAQSLAGVDPLQAAAWADEERRRRHGVRTTFTLVRSVDLRAAPGFQPLTGAPAADATCAPDQLEAALRRLAHPACGDYQVVPPEGIDAAGLIDLCRRTAAVVEEIAAAGAPGAPRPTFQMGTADAWMDAGVEALAAAHAAGLRVLSDGVRPERHPALGAAVDWHRLWTEAGAVGLRGNAAILFGPGRDLDAVLDQIEAVEALQDAEGVFQSVAPVVFGPEGFAGPDDQLLSQGQQDVRILAACRLGAPGIEHLRFCYDRSDLKMAHLALACGVDDLEGRLFPGDRGPKEAADAADLSLDEMGRWLEEAGYAAALRNGAFEILPEEGP
jgi:hypothetical protein